MNTKSLFLFNKPFISLVIGIACLFSTSFASANVINYQYSGVMNTSFGTVSSGSIFTGSFSYETVQPNQATLSTNGKYDFLSFNLNLGGNLISGTDISTDDAIDIVDSISFDTFFIRAINLSGATGGLTPFTIEFALSDFTCPCQGITSTNLPISPLNLSDFQSTTIRLLSINPTNSALVDSTGVITSLSISSVPEPTTLTLMGLGLAGLGLIRRKCI